MDQDCSLVTVRGLTLDPVTSAPIVILRTEDGSRLLPIWIGPFEANAIALHMERVRTPRPLTHDLLRDLVALLGAETTRVVVDGLADNTFRASIYLRAGGDEERRLDARPSDAIALALRAGAPIFVARDVLERARGVDVGEGPGDEMQWKQWLERITPGDFGAIDDEGPGSRGGGDGREGG